MMRERNWNRVIKELVAIKKLLILYLLKQGLTSEDLGKTLGIDSSTVRHMVSIKSKKSRRGKRNA